MRILALLLGLLLQSLSFAELSGLVFCNHGDGQVVLEIAGALCCDPSCAPDRPRETTPSGASLSGGDLCVDQRVSFCGPQLPPSRGHLCLSTSRSLESSLSSGHSTPPVAREPEKHVADFGLRVAGTALACVHTVALRC